MPGGLVYSFVARADGVVLAEGSNLAGNFRTVALECLQNSSNISDDKFTVTADQYTFNYLRSSGYSEYHICMAPRSNAVMFVFLILLILLIDTVYRCMCSILGGGR